MLKSLCARDSVSCDELLETLRADLEDQRKQFLAAEHELEQQHLAGSISDADFGDRLRELSYYEDRIGMDYSCRVETILSTFNEHGELKENYSGWEVEKLLLGEFA